MKTDIVRLRMPFKKGWLFREKEVPFLFKIMTLEMTCDHLGVEFGQLFSTSKDATDVYRSIIWNGYLAACMTLYRKPKYAQTHAFIWSEYMSSKTKEKFMDEIKKLMGYLEGQKVEKIEDELKKK